MLSEPQKEHALRMMEGARPKFRKGIYGKQYNSHSCGNCGRGIDVVYDYCPQCGYRILWDNPRCLTDYQKDEVEIDEGFDDDNQDPEGSGS